MYLSNVPVGKSLGSTQFARNAQLFLFPATDNTLVSGNRYLVDCDTTERLYLPALPANGEFIAIVSTGTDSTTLLDTQGNALNGVTADGVILPGITSYLIFRDGNWIAPLLGTSISFGKPVYQWVEAAWSVAAPQLLNRATDGNPFTACTEGITGNSRTGVIYCDLGATFEGIARVSAIIAKDSFPGSPGQWGVASSANGTAWTLLNPQTLSPTSVRQNIVFESAFNARYVGAFCKDVGTGRVVLSVQEISVS